jgi:hypothetical protein
VPGGVAAQSRSSAPPTVAAAMTPDATAPGGGARRAPAGGAPVSMAATAPPGWGPVTASPGAWGALTILGGEVAPGEKREVIFFTTESFQASSVKSPVLVVRGTEPGPTLCLTAAVHGDELNGVEVVRRVLDETNPRGFRGTLIGVPIVNVLGFERSSRYLPDRRDLNRYFPGHPRGSSASRIAYTFFEAIVRKCDALVDLHTGSFHRANMPQIRGDLLNPKVAALAKGFGADVVVHHRGREGTLRRAATDAGIPTIIYEGGEPMRFQPSEIERGAAGVRNLLVELGHLGGRRLLGPAFRTFYETHWIRVNHGGILVSDVHLGDWVDTQQRLGLITDPMGRGRGRVTSPYKGRVIGIGLAPVVMPGAAVYHIGLERPAPDGAAEGAVAPESLEPEDERPE